MKTKLQIVRNDKLIKRERDSNALRDFLHWAAKDSIVLFDVVAVLKILVERELKRKR